MISSNQFDYYSRHWCNFDSFSLSIEVTNTHQPVLRNDDDNNNAKQMIMIINTS